MKKSDKDTNVEHDEDMSADLAIEIYELLKSKCEGREGEGIGEALHALEMVVASIFGMVEHENVDKCLISFAKFAKNVKIITGNISKISDK